MLFSESVPEKVLLNRNTQRFLSVMDSLQEYKQGIIGEAIRTFNPILSTNGKWLRKNLADYGFSELPDGFPIRVMQQMLLNANTIMGLRGSKLGLEFFLSVSSLGVGSASTDADVDNFNVLFPDSDLYGYITAEKPDRFGQVDYTDSGFVDKNSLTSSYAVGGRVPDLPGINVGPTIDRPTAEQVVKSGEFLYLCDSNELNPESTITITLSSKYFDGTHDKEASAIQTYLKNVIDGYLGFHPNTKITWKFSSRTSFYYHPLLNQNFVN